MADLAAYNEGVLHGVWIDADLDADDISVIHSLKDRNGPLIVTACGYSVKLKAGEAMPRDITGWGSKVSCPACKEAR